MSKRAIARGIGAGLQALGTGLIEAKVQQEVQTQQKFENNLATRRANLEETALDLEREVNLWNEEYGTAILGIEQQKINQGDGRLNLDRDKLKLDRDRLNSEEAQKQLDRIFVKERAYQDAVLRATLMIKQTDLDKNKLAYAQQLENTAMTRRAMLETLQRGRAVGMDIMSEKAKGVLQFMLLPAPPEGDTEAMEKYLQDQERAKEQMREIQAELSTLSTTDLDEDLPVSTPAQKVVPEDSGNADTPSVDNAVVRRMSAYTAEQFSTVLKSMVEDKVLTDAEAKILKREVDLFKMMKGQAGILGDIMESLKDFTLPDFSNVDSIGQ